MEYLSLHLAWICFGDGSSGRTSPNKNTWDINQEVIQERKKPPQTWLVRAGFAKVSANLNKTEFDNPLISWIYQKKQLVNIYLFTLHSETRFVFLLLFFPGGRTFSNVLPHPVFPRSRPTSASLVVPFITFPVIRTTPRKCVSRSVFWWQFFGAQKCLFRGDMSVFFCEKSGTPPKKTKLEREWIFKKDGAEGKYEVFILNASIWSMAKTIQSRENLENF